MELDDNRLVYWMRFIKAEGEEELEAIAKSDPTIKKAVLRLMELSADEEARLLYEAREKARMDFENRIYEACMESEKARLELESSLAESESTLAEKDKEIAELKAQLASICL